MKRILKTSIAVILGLVLVFFALSVFIRVKAKEIVKEKCQNVFRKQVDIKDVRLSFPFNLCVSELTIEDFGSVKKAVIGMGLINLFNREISLSKLKLFEPHFTMRIPRDIKKFKDALPQTQEKVVLQRQDVEKKEMETSRLNIYINYLFIKDGEIIFTDSSLNQQNQQIVLKDLNLQINKISIPSISKKTEFKIEAVVSGANQNFQDGQISGHGWANFLLKDLEGEININNLDSRVLLAFLGKQNRFLKNAIVDLTAFLQSRSNNMSVKCGVKIKELNLKGGRRQSSDSFSFEDIFAKNLESLAEGVELSFNFKTKMDDFKIESVSFSGAIWQDGNQKGPQGTRSFLLRGVDFITKAYAEVRQSVYN